MSRRRRGGEASATSSATGSPALLFGATPPKKKMYSYTLDVKPEDAEQATIDALLQKVRELKVGKVKIKEGSVAARQNAFGETSVQAAFTTEDRADADAVEDEMEGWAEVDDVTVTRTVVEFKIAKETANASPAAATSPTKLKTVAQMVLGKLGEGKAGARVRTRNRPTTPQHSGLSEAQRKKKLKAQRKQERAEALALLQKLLVVHTEQIETLRKRLMDEEGQMRAMDRVELTGVTLTNDRPPLIGKEIRHVT